MATLLSLTIFHLPKCLDYNSYDEDHAAHANMFRSGLEGKHQPLWYFHVDIYTVVVVWKY